MQVLLIIGGIILTVLTTCIGERLFKLITQKIRCENLRRILKNIKNVILDNVKTAQQTYVDELKVKEKFDKKAQEEILILTKNKIIDQLTKEAKDYIKNTYGNLDDYIITKIESTIYDLKYR